MPHPLITSWRKTMLKKPPFLFPGDEVLLDPKNRNKISIIKSYAEYCRSAQFGGDETELQLGLLPAPYWGDLKRADVFILMLNPGLRPINYYSEYEMPFWRKMLMSNLKQKAFDKEYPNIFLNPRYSWDGGFIYWTDKFKSILKTLSLRKAISYQEALSILARRVACLQLVPYHSRAFASGSLVSKLHSSRLIRAYANEVLLPRARRGEIRIIVLRGDRFWGLPAGKNVTVYGNHEARGAALSVGSRGGRVILGKIKNDCQT